MRSGPKLISCQYNRDTNMVKKSNPPTPVGEVVLASKAMIPPVKPVKPVKPVPPPSAEPLISATKYEKEIRPKKELTEKQKDNLTKLIERNKARAVERRAVVKETVPESIPEDKILVRIKPKRAYNRKPKEEASKNVVVEPTPEPTPASSEAEYSESEPEVKPRKRRERKQAPKKKIVPKYSYDTETTTADEDSTDSDEDDYKVTKYQAKAEKRIKALEKIDKRLNQLHNNPYQSRELSVF